MHKAAKLGLVQICRFLVANGVDTSIKNSENNTAIDVATPATSKAIREEPIKGNTDIESQLLEMAKNGDLEGVKVWRCVVNIAMNEAMF